MSGSSELKPAQPLLKWPGGKRFLSQRLATAINTVDYNTYFEPFLGGASTFFALLPEKAVLSDLNFNLINFYKCVQGQPFDLITRLRRARFINTEDNFYIVRNYRPRNAAQQAARFYYLQRLSFNGIYRENFNGEFNVPYGQKLHLSQVDSESILSCSSALQNAQLHALDFRTILNQSKRGDFVYADPPYTTLHDKNGFVKYNQHLFSFEDQQELALVSNRLIARGVHVVISNADHSSIEPLYATGFRKLKIERFSRIAAASSARKKVYEALYISDNIGREFDKVLCS